MPTLNLSIAANPDDGYYADTSGSYSDSFSTLFLTAATDSHSWMRFTNVTIPQGATITSAILTLVSSMTGSAASTLRLDAWNQDNPANPSSNADALSRPLTTANVPWTVPAFTTNTSVNAPDLATVVQEIVNRSGWASGNAITIAAHNTGAGGHVRTAYARDNGTSQQATLQIVYSTTSFAIAPTAIPNNHSGNITLTLTGTGTTWTSSTVFTPSGVANVTKVSQNVTSNTSATVVVTTGAGTGTLTLTESVTGTNTATTAVTAASIARTPTGITVSTTGNVISLTGTNTIWSTDSPTFSLSGGTGASITAQNITTNTAATVTISAGSATGTLTITDPSTGATATVTVNPLSPGALSDTNTFWSPYTWFDGGTYREAVPAGAYVLVNWTGTGIAVTVSLARYVAASASAGQYPQIEWSIDNGPWQSYQFASSDTFKALASSLSNTAHDLRLHLKNTDPNLSRFTTTTPVGGLMITGFTAADGSTPLTTTNAPAARSKRMIFYGDSITEGNGLGFTTWAPRVAEALDAAYGLLGYGGTGLTAAGSGDPGPFFTPSNDALSYWNKYHTGATRLVSGLFSPAPDYIVFNHGTNDRGLGSMTPVTAAMSGWLTAARAAAPNARIFVVTPFAGYAAVTAAIISGFNAVADAKMHLINISAAFPGWETTASSVRWTSDTLHPNALGAAEIGARVAQAIQAILSAGSGGRRRVW